MFMEEHDGPRWKCIQKVLGPGGVFIEIRLLSDFYRYDDLLVHKIDEYIFNGSSILDSPDEKF